jgi:hypothetical protein
MEPMPDNTPGAERPSPRPVRDVGDAYLSAAGQAVSYKLDERA